MDINKMNSQRNKILSLYLVAIIIVVTTLLLGFYVLESIITIIVGIIVAIILFVIAGINKRKYTDTFKETFVISGLNKIFSDVKYDKNSGLNVSFIDSLNMIDMGDRAYTEDYFEGKYKDVQIKVSDLVIEELRSYVDKDGHIHTYYVPIFTGQFIVSEFNKKFNSVVRVVQKNFGNSIVMGEKVKLETVSFNKKFETYSLTDIDAFYLLTPQMMERIENLKDQIKGKMMFSFENDKLYIALNSGKSMLEPPTLFKKLDEKNAYDKVYGDIETITRFVDELRLDDKLFK